MIDFDQMRRSDSQRKSMFEVAGRVYYEAHVFGYKVSSFTSSGFLDRQGYQPEEVTSSKLRFLNQNQIAIIAGCAAIAIMVKIMRGSKDDKVKKE